MPVFNLDEITSNFNKSNFWKDLWRFISCIRGLNEKEKDMCIRLGISRKAYFKEKVKDTWGRLRLRDMYKWELRYDTSLREFTENDINSDGLIDVEEIMAGNKEVKAETGIDVDGMIDDIIESKEIDTFQLTEEELKELKNIIKEKINLAIGETAVESIESNDTQNVVIGMIEEKVLTIKDLLIAIYNMKDETKLIIKSEDCRKTWYSSVISITIEDRDEVDEKVIVLKASKDWDKTL